MGGEGTREEDDRRNDDKEQRKDRHHLAWHGMNGAQKKKQTDLYVYRYVDTSVGQTTGRPRVIGIGLGSRRVRHTSQGSSFLLSFFLLPFFLSFFLSTREREKEEVFRIISSPFFVCGLHV